MLSEFPTLTQVCSPDIPIKHDVTLQFETTDFPVSARPRRLALDRLHAAKQQFERLESSDSPNKCQSASWIFLAITPLPEKVQTIRDFPQPESQ